jgi:hypothetical protein
MFVVTNQNLLLWCRRVDPKMPPEGRRSPATNWLRRVRMFPICSHVTRSLLWKMGAPGKYSKLEVVRK